MTRDRRPAWMLRKQARISSQRRATTPGALPADLATWWQQIVAAAADLRLEPGETTDWQSWPPAPIDDMGG